MRASAVVKRQSALAVAALRRHYHAAVCRFSAALSPTRSGRSRLSALNSISAMFSYEPCLGVRWTSSLLAMCLAPAGGMPCIARRASGD